MEKISATKLRRNLFDYLDQAKSGKTVIIERNDQEVAKLVPINQVNWRERVNIPLKILVSFESLNAPFEEWEDYV